MEKTAKLECFNSRADTYGNCYWAFRFTDYATGAEVVGKVTGGESNIYGILRHWNEEDGWDRSVDFQRIKDMKIREFDRMVKEWPHAGCNCEDLADYIRKSLAG